MNWKPINKVLAGIIVGGVVVLAERFIPGLKNNLPVGWQSVLPLAAAMVTAYLVKLEKDLPGNL
jgi:hypothetical protein